MRELIGKYTFSNEIKKSRFIAHAIPAASSEEAIEAIEAVKDPSATHNCFAYRIGEVYRFSDDGEPGGTAGRPILSAIEKQDVDRCLVVVIRFFGGIKLGAGGLVRAYGGTAAECLRTAPTQEIRLMTSVELTAPFDAIGEIYTLLLRYDADKEDEQYLSDGVCLRIRLEARKTQSFEKDLTEATRGRGRVLDPALKS